MTTEQELELARTIAREVSQKALHDEEYHRRLLDDPAETLSAAGMPPSGIAGFLLEEGLDEDEVSGYLATLGIAIRPGSFSTPGRGAAAAAECVCTNCCVTGKHLPGLDWRINPARS